MLDLIAAAFANLLTRFLPLLFFKKHYKKFLFLKDQFPVVLLTILTLYILFPKELDLVDLKYKLLGVAVTITIHLLFRRFLLSIFTGSIVYILLVNKFF